jgi:TonB family protein
LLLAGIVAVVAHGAVVPEPSQFYTVSVFFSDNGALFYYRILDVRQDGPGSVVRYVRIAPSSLYCPRVMVQAVESRVAGASPAQLAGQINPCAVRPDALRSSVERYRRTDGVFEAISFGIVAQCGPSSVALALPIGQKVDLNRLRKARPEMARLWELAGTVENRVFGERNLFHDRQDAEEAALQSAGQKLIPELVSGYYDSGLRLAVTGNVGTWQSPSLKSLLAGYAGPVNPKNAIPVPQLIHAQAYQFSKYVGAVFPPLALQARIQGRVELQLTVESSTGQVHSVAAVSGHPLLTPSATHAAKQWRFAPDSVSSGTLNVTLEYSIRCP